MKVKREQLLQVLDSVYPGVSQRDILEQSSCFIFRKGKVETFNDELYCCRKTGMDKTITGAVRADKLLEQLRKWLDEDIDVTSDGKHLLVAAGKKKMGLVLQAEIVLPLEHVERPTEWRKLPEDFGDAVSVVQQCASTDESVPTLTYVHIAPKWVEACDNFQACRWPMKTKLGQSMFVRRESIRHVGSMGATEWSETEGWLHFRSPNGLELSCRRYIDDYPDLSPVLTVEGEKAKLPKGLAEACDKAGVFSGENADMNNVTIQLGAGKLIVRGEGASGWYSETRKADYHGESMTFSASPAVLADLVKRHTECTIGDGKLLVDAGSYQYVLNLYVPELVPDGKDEEDAEAGKEAMKKVRKKAVDAEEAE